MKAVEINQGFNGEVQLVAAVVTKPCAEAGWQGVGVAFKLLTHESQSQNSKPKGKSSQRKQRHIEGVMTMSSDFAIRVDAQHPQWTGSGSTADDRKKRQLLKLKALIHALDQGDLESARQAFVAFVNLTPQLSHDETLSKVGAALQSSHLAAAKHFVKHLEHLERQWFAAASPWSGKKSVRPSVPVYWANGILKIDFSV